MKQIILLLVLFASLQSFGQSVQSKSMCVANACRQTITTTDSVQVFVQVTTTDPAWSAVWKQLAGTSVALPKAGTALGGYSGFVLKNLPAGTYIFSALVTGTSGLSMPASDTVVVNPAIRRLVYITATATYSDSSKVTTIVQ